MKKSISFGQTDLTCQQQSPRFDNSSARQTDLQANDKLFYVEQNNMYYPGQAD